MLILVGVHNVVFLDIQIPWITLQHKTGKIKQLFLEGFGSFLNRQPRYVGLSGGIGTGIVGSDISVLLADHMNLVHR